MGKIKEEIDIIQQIYVIRWTCNLGPWPISMNWINKKRAHKVESTYEKEEAMSKEEEKAILYALDKRSIGSESAILPLSKWWWHGAGA